MTKAIKLAENLSKFRLITFDVNDTLLRVSKAPGIQYAQTASMFGYKNIDESRLTEAFKAEFKKSIRTHPNFGLNTLENGWHQWWQDLVVKIFARAGANVPTEDLLRIGEKLIGQYATDECWQKVDGAEQILRKLNTASKLVGVISNFDPRLHEIVANIGFPEFEFVLTSYEFGTSKPDARIFKEAQRRCGIAAEEALHVGNTLDTDYMGAVNAGWSAVHISNSSEDWRYNPAVNENHVFRSIESLLETLESCDVAWS